MHRFDRELADIERAQHGLIAISQLTDPETWTRARIEHRVRGRREHRHRGVWASPSVDPTFRQHALAMVLAAGVDAFASHETAVALRELPLPGPALLEVTTGLERRPYVPGVRMHRSGLVTADDVTVVDGIRTATASSRS